MENLKQFITGMLESSDLADDVYDDLKINLRDLTSVVRVPGIVDKVAQAPEAWKELIALDEAGRTEIIEFIKSEALSFKRDEESDRLTEYLEKGLIAAVNLSAAVSIFIPH